MTVILEKVLFLNFLFQVFTPPKDHIMFRMGKLNFPLLLCESFIIFIAFSHLHSSFTPTKEVEKKLI